MEIVLFSIGILVLLVLIVQSILLYTVYNSNLKREIPKMDTKSKEWIAFSNLFENIESKGYVIIFNKGIEEIMLHFNRMGLTHDYQKEKYILKQIYFENEGEYEDEVEGNVPGRFASYELNVDDIAIITEVENYYGDHGNREDMFCVECILKDGRKIQIIFTYKGEKNDGNR